MKQNVLIDPYMFYLKNSIDIQNNLPFFQKVIELCNAGKISIVLYQGLLEKISNWQINPFPIAVKDIKDSGLKNQVLILNYNFVKVLSSEIIGVEIDSCSGPQEFSAFPDLSKDSEYYELLSVMLSSCYNKKINITPHVLIGNIKATMQDGDNVVVKCVCEECKFEQKYDWCKLNVFEDEKDIAFNKMKNIIADNHLFVDEPETIRADHHCLLQNKAIQKYRDFTTRNKMVLSLLRHFGLFKIILTEFHEDASYVPGTIIITEVCKGADCEIAEGWLFCQTGYKTLVKLYFPKEMGSCLSKYTDKLFSYEKIEKLKTRLCI